MIRGEFRSHGAEVVTVPTDRRWIRFGPYCADLRACELTKHGTRLKLQARPFEILTMLLERPGELISKQDLMSRVWPNTFVEPANLTVHISALRHTLRDGHDGNRFIVNVPGRGYSFVASVEVRHATNKVTNQPR